MVKEHNVFVRPTDGGDPVQLSKTGVEGNAFGMLSWSADSKAIVGFRIRISRLEGKWKLNQNHPAERQALVATALEEQGGENAREIAALMRANLGRT